MLCVTCIDMKPSDRLERVWSRQQGRWSVKGPDTFRLSSYLVGSNVHAIVSLCLARKYIYRQEICMLLLGPPSLDPVDRLSYPACSSGVDGVEWIRVEWIGVAEWSRVEQSGAEWSRVDWSGLEWIGVERSGVEWRPQIVCRLSLSTG